MIDWQQSDGTLSTSNSLSALLETVFHQTEVWSKQGCGFCPHYQALPMSRPHLKKFFFKAVSLNSGVASLSVSRSEMGVAFLPVRPSEKDVLLDCASVPKKGGVVSLTSPS